VNSGTTGRRIVTLAAMFWAAGMFLIVLGALFPSVPLLGLLGTIFESFLSLHIVILGVIGVLLAAAAWQLGSRRGAAIATTLAALAVVGALVPLFSLSRAARRHGAPISWSDHLRITAPGDAARPNLCPSQRLTGKICTQMYTFPRDRAAAFCPCDDASRCYVRAAKHGSGLTAGRARVHGIRWTIVCASGDFELAGEDAAVRVMVR
jgi:hypothetical protein